MDSYAKCCDSFASTVRFVNEEVFYITLMQLICKAVQFKYISIPMDNYAKCCDSSASPVRFYRDNCCIMAEIPIAIKVSLCAHCK